MFIDSKIRIITYELRTKDLIFSIVQPHAHTIGIRRLFLWKSCM